MASMKLFLLASLVFVAVVCSKLAVLAYDDVLAPMPAMATGSAAGCSASVAAMGFFLMVYVFDDDLRMQFESSKLKSTTD
ncbi:hypothetical protein NC651_002723 [Populus alba x Populus x berolinensis]|nr:hypothetical protein NC651_002723 [Populus alba x Populus x berolinensis]